MLTYQPGGDLTQSDLNQTGSLIGQRTGTLIYLTVSGDINESALVTDFKINRFQEYGPIDISLAIENQSNVHIRPKGQITITNSLTRSTEILPLEEINIFPDQSRTYTLSTGSKWMLGRYQAVANIAYGTTGQSLSTIVYFWVFPWKIALIGLAILITLIYIAAYLNHRRQTHKDEIEELKENLTEREKSTNSEKNKD